MAGPKQVRKTEDLTIQQRMNQAEQVIRERLAGAGTEGHRYTPREIDEIIRMSRMMIGVGRQRPRSPTLEANNPLHRNIQPADLVSARDAFAAAVRATGTETSTQRAIADARIGFRGPEIAISVREVPPPTRIRTYTYSISLTDAQGRQYSYDLTMNRPLRSGRLAENLFQTIGSQEGRSGIIAVTSGDQRVATEQFARVYRNVYMDLNIPGSEAHIYISGVNPVTRRSQGT